MPNEWGGFLLGAASSSLVVPLLLGLLRLRRVPVAPGWAVVLRRGERTRVSLRSRLVWPGTEVYRLAVHPHGFDIELRDADAVWSKDRARIEVVARVRVRIDPGQAVAVLDWLGCERASDGKVLADLFAPSIEEALHAVASTFTGEDVYTRRLEFRDRVLEVVAPHLRGFVMDDLAISTFQKIG